MRMRMRGGGGHLQIRIKEELRRAVGGGDGDGIGEGDESGGFAAGAAGPGEATEAEEIEIMDDGGAGTVEALSECADGDGIEWVAREGGVHNACRVSGAERGATYRYEAGLGEACR
jgi:hypothetical protein